MVPYLGCKNQVTILSLGYGLWAVITQYAIRFTFYTRRPAEATDMVLRNVLDLGGMCLPDLTTLMPVFAYDRPESGGNGRNWHMTNESEDRGSKLEDRGSTHLSILDPRALSR
jgi:hypothetical protein